MIYEKYFGMEKNLFQKNYDSEMPFKSNDFNQVLSRLEHLKSTKGIGLFTGNSGTGKTFCLKHFSKGLNKNMFKVVYIPLSTVTVLEFYRSLAIGLGIEPPSKKIDIFNSIQERIISLSKGKKIVPVVIVDESQYLKTEVLNDLKMLFNFEMDSVNHAILILNGQPVLNNILSKGIHEALKQRIIINYNSEGLSNVEIKEYIDRTIKLSGITEEIFTPNAYESINSCANKSIRKVNTLIDKCLLIAFNQDKREIDTDIVMMAQNNIELCS